jgi:S1-C subfamily serine protease
MTDYSASLHLPALSAALVDLVRIKKRSVVSIQSGRAPSSGFAWRPGLIVAAESALAEDGEISVVAHDKASGPARLVGRDSSSDVAVLRVEREDLPQPPPPARDPAVGALAIVLGARGGAPAASLGAISFVGPQWRSLRGGLIDARIELDTRLSRASEGGLALDAEGRAFGMAVFGPRRRTIVIPMATIERVGDILAAKGKVGRGYLGLGLQPVRIDSGGIGAMAISVDPKGPGAAAGIKQGDVIVEWDGQAVDGVHRLLRALGPDSVGSTVKLALSRAGEPLELGLTIGERPESR